MTTVIVDARAGVIASDNMATTNEGDIPIYCQKIFPITKGPNKGDFVGSVGIEGPFYVFLDAYTGGDNLEPLNAGESDAFEAVILKSDGRIFVADHWMRPYELETAIYGSGSGGGYAMAAMLAGATIEESLLIACAMDSGSNMMNKAAQIGRIKKNARRRK